VLDGVDVTNTAMDFAAFEGRRFEVAMTRRPTEVTGTVRDIRGRPATDFVAVIFADERERWTPYTTAIATAHPDAENRFTVRSLPPGRYLAAAVDSLLPGEERNPSTLERLRRSAVALTLGDAESLRVELTVEP
jgi:hypothetical protein